MIVNLNDSVWDEREREEWESEFFVCVLLWVFRDGWKSNEIEVKNGVIFFEMEGPAFR